MPIGRLPIVPLVALGLVALLAALWGGLLRIGWSLPAPLSPAVVHHGPLMIGGFLGAVIGLERAAALDERWAFAPPALAGLGTVALLVGPTSLLGPVLIALSSLGLLATHAEIARRQLALYTVTMALGALAWLVGNALWLGGWPVHRAVPWWAGAIILIVAGERLELGRVLSLARSATLAFASAVALLIAGLLLSTVSYDAGVRVAGIGLVVLTGWLATSDVARRTVRQRGMTRFTAICLLAGYAWLGVAGALGVLFGGVTSGYQYDALLHAIFLGFAFSMIFGHAPVVLPALLGRPLPFQTHFYGHLALLHLSLLVRVAGDLSQSLSLRQWGGLINVLAVLLFLAVTARAVRASTPRPTRRVAGADPPAA